MDSTTTTPMSTTTMTTSSTVTFDMELNITVTEQNGADYFYQVEQLTFLWVLFTLIVIGNFSFIQLIGRSNMNVTTLPIP